MILYNTGGILELGVPMCTTAWKLKCQNIGASSYTEQQKLVHCSQTTA